MSKKILKISIINLFLATILLGSIIATVSAQLPVIDIEEDKATWSPTSIHYDSYYYTIPAGTKFNNVIYKGSTGLGYYTTVGVNNFGFTDDDLVRKSSVTDWFLENTSRTNPHPFFGDDSYPVGVRIDNHLNPAFEQTQKKAINLHMDHSYTFIAGNNVEYFGFINTSDPFYLDIYLYDSGASGSINFPDAHPFSYYIGTHEKMTYPIFPRNNSQSSLLNFTFVLTSGTSVVSLTPHPWEFPDWMPTIEANSSFVGEFSQGSIYTVDTKTGDLTVPENDLFSIRMFNISIEQDNYYKIFTDYNMRDGYSPITFLIGDHYDHISGSLSGGEYYFYAKESENTALVLFSPGHAHGDYSVYFQNLAPVTPDYETLPLTINTNITLEQETYYTLTFDVPYMMAINSTDWFGLDFYVQGAKENDWIRIPDWWTFQYGNWLAIDDLDWLYIPEGTYAFECTFYYNLDEEIRFNAVPVNDPDTFTVNQDSIYAIELPLSYNRINLVNISTNTHTTPPERVWYEWTFVGKYDELVAADTGSGFIGNENITNPGVWEEWGSNNTNINAYLRTRDHEIPILMIRPYEANNWTDQTTPLPGFLATLTVSVNEAIDQSGQILQGGGFGINNAYIGDGTFIPLSAISTTNSFNVNDDYTADNDQIYGIPLNLDPYSIYNISVYFYGNNSLTDRNASFDGWSVYMHGGNLRDLEIFNTQVNKAYPTNTSVSMLILTVSSTTYLYVDMYRDWVPSESAYANSTMEVIITKVSTNMMFDLPDYEYNDTESDQEVFTDDLLATQMKVSEMRKPRRAIGFDLLLAIGTLVILTTGISLKRRKR
ncbi:MAG: hypothetical protein ACFE8U_12910 [Candidatus Hermodarchaeota archaeon]